MAYVYSKNQIEGVLAYHYNNKLKALNFKTSYEVIIQIISNYPSCLPKIQ